MQQGLLGALQDPQFYGDMGQRLANALRTGVNDVFPAPSTGTLSEDWANPEYRDKMMNMGLAGMTAPKTLYHGGKIMASGIAAGSLALAQTARLTGGDDDDDVSYYDKIPTWVKQNNIIFMRPGISERHKKTGDKSVIDGIDYIKIPVPYGFNIFYAIGQAIDMAIQGKPVRGQYEYSILG